MRHARAWLLALLLAASGAPAAERFTLNLKDTDIESLITTVSEVTGRNFVVDPRVKGKVSVISSHAMAPDELYQVFQSVLQVHGFATVPAGGVTRIVPAVDAKQDSLPTGAGEVENSAELVTQVVEVKYAAAAHLVQLLRPLMPQGGHLAAYEPSNTLIFADRAANIRRMLDILKRVDVPGSEEVELIRLEHADAAEVVRLLGQIKRAQTPGKDTPASAEASLVADSRSNSVLLSGDKATRLRLRTLISHLDTPLERGGNTEVVYLRYARAKDLLTVLKGVGDNLTKQGKGQTVPVAASDYALQADESTNALVIMAPPDMLRALKDVVRRLDIRRRQVLVEAVIAEVTANKEVELGVQWRTSPGALTGQGSFGGTTFPGTQSGSIDAFPGAPVALGTGLSLGLFRGGDIRLLLRALAADTDSNILSTPSLVTLDNQEAEIVVGQNVPFVTGQYSNTGGGTTPANPFQTIERKDVGVLLKIKPQINEGDAVKLDLTQEASSIDRATAGADLITNKRSIKTSVLVRDGDTIVLGGLIRDDVQETVQRVPLLGDIPVLGEVFKNTSTARVKTNLMVFLRPAILNDDAASARVTGGKYTGLRALQLERRAGGVRLMPGESTPLLPELPASDKGSPPSAPVDAPPP